MNGYDGVVMCYPKPPRLALTVKRAGIPIRVGTSVAGGPLIFASRCAVALKRKPS